MSKPASEFERVASEEKGNFFGDLWYMLRQNGKWWLLPIFIILLLFAGLMLLSGTAVAPFIYTIF